MPPPPLILSRYREIAASVAQRLCAGRRPDPLAPWDLEVVAASSGMGSAVASEVLRRTPQGVANLRIHVLDVLAARIVNAAGEYPRVATDAEHRLAMRTAVRAVRHRMLESRGLAGLLERSYRDVRDTGLSIDEFAARAKAATGLRDRSRSLTIVEIWREYERLITLAGAIDPADLLGRAAEIVTEGRVALPPQFLAGFYDLTGAQLRLVSALAGAGKLAGIWIPASADDAGYRFAHPLITRFASGLDPRAPLLHIKAPSLSVMEFDSKQNEIHGICREVRALLDQGVPAGEIAIVVRAIDPYDVHLLTRFATELGFCISHAEEVPLLSQRMGRALRTLLLLRDRNFPRGEVLEILREGFRTDANVDLDRLDAETRRAQIAGGSSSELRLLQHRSATVDAYIQFVQELEELTLPLSTPMRGRDWSHVLRRFLERFRFLCEADASVAEQIDATADLLRRSDIWNRRFESNTILELLESVSIPVEQPVVSETMPRIWFGDVMRFRGRSFEHVFAIRMQDDLFPQRRTEDALLPDSDRRILGVHEIGNGRDEEQFLFQLVLDAATNTTRFSFAAADALGRMLRPSQLVKNYLVARHPESAHAILDDFSKFVRDNNVCHLEPGRADREGLGMTLRPLQLLARAGSSGTFDGYLGEAFRERFESALQATTPTQLEEYGECPQKFLIRHLFKVEDLDHPERQVEIDPRRKGSSNHRILESFYRGLTAEAMLAATADLPCLPESLAQSLNAAIDAEYVRLQDEIPPFNPTIREMERSATRRVLREFVATDIADLIARGMMPVHFEYRFGKPRRDGRTDHPDPFTIGAHGVSLRVEGMIDRIDAGGGRLRVVDYKLGKAFRHTKLGEKIDRGVRLQLALYALAVCEFFGLNPSAVSATIKPLVIGEKPDDFAFELAEKEGVVRETLDLFARSILAGRFPAFPNEKDKEFNSCKYCPVNHSCRTKHDNAENRSVRRHSDPRSLLGELS